MDRHSASLTTEQIAIVLWEDRIYDRTMKNYVSTVNAFKGEYMTNYSWAEFTTGRYMQMHGKEKNE